MEALAATWLAGIIHSSWHAGHDGEQRNELLLTRSLKMAMEFLHCLR